MYRYFKEREVTLLGHPEIRVHHVESMQNQIITGDAHSNPIALIYTLLKEGAIKGLTTQEYDELVYIYQTNYDKLTRTHLNRFRDILAKCQEVKHHALLNMGDEICDRGMNDIFMLYFYERFAESLSIRAPLSNHGAAFLRAWHSDFKLGPLGFDIGSIRTESTVSCNNLAHILRRSQQGFPNDEIVCVEELINLTKEYYLPTLKAVHYDKEVKYNETTGEYQTFIALYTHAPIGLNTIKMLADKLDLPYADDTPEILINTIDAINEVYQKALFDKSLFAKLFNEGDCEHPTWKLTWNRDYRDLYRPREIQSGDNPPYYLYFIHGHDENDPKAAFIKGNHIFSLDNPLGEGENWTGTYEVLINHLPVPKLELQETKSARLFSSHSKLSSLNSSSSTLARSPSCPFF